MNKITRKIFFIVVLFVVLTLNYFYGAIFYSKITGQEKEYTIGRACMIDIVSCENTYFKDLLGNIESLKNDSRTFFSNIFIEEDQIGYTGNCPCPNDIDRRGYLCGGRSSYSKSDRISYCYDSDVSDIQISNKRNSMVLDAEKILNTAVKKDINIFREKITLLAILFFTILVWITLERKDWK